MMTSQNIEVADTEGVIPVAPPRVWQILDPPLPEAGRIDFMFLGPPYPAA